MSVLFCLPLRTGVDIAAQVNVVMIDVSERTPPAYAQGVADPRMAVDDFTLEWSDFGEFLDSRTDLDAPYLTALDAPGGRRHWAVGQWRATVASTSDWLAHHGVGPGAAVATLLGNTVEALAIAFACWRTGACYVPLNPNDSAERQAYIVADSGAMLAVLSSQAADLTAALEVRPDLELILDPVVDDLPAPQQDDVAGRSRPGRVTAGRHGHGLDAPALQVYTSGTTGEPKGVVLTARNLLTDADALLQGTGWGPGTRVYTVLPIHHVNALVISSLLPWYGAFSTVLASKFRTETFWEDAAEESANVCSVVPSLLEFLLRREGGPHAGFREFLVGAGPLLPETVLEFEDRYALPVRHLYGLSETTAVVTLVPRLSPKERRYWYSAHGPPSVGPALPHLEVEVQDHHGQQVGEGERGEIVVRGGVVMQGYAGLGDATSEAFRDGWFHSGDEGFWKDRDGTPMFFITGRIKELIIRGGANIAPVEVDQVLRSHPAVDFALAVPFANRVYGEEVAAYLVTNAPVSDEEILAHCAKYLDHSRCPKVILRGDEIPYTSTGKAKRIELARRLAPELEQYRDHQFRRSGSEA